MVSMPHWPVFNKSLNVSIDERENIKLVLSELGNPEKNMPPIIHVAGTNGKGSTIAFLSSFFKEAGYKSHIYTSPHLHEVNERISIANSFISDKYLYQILEEIRYASIKINIPDISFMGVFTIAAILAFSKNDADICIIETGMGGRTDSTNVLDDKLITIITSIFYDHEEFLGTNLSLIAKEKSCIMRKNVYSIVAQQTQEAGMIIETKSEEIKNKLLHYNQNFYVEVNKDETFNFFYNFQDIKISLKNLPKSSLEGDHQYYNSSLAISCIITIAKHFEDKSINLLSNPKYNFVFSKKDIERGLIDINWPCRIEKINHLHFMNLKQNEIWIDGAHNVSGAYVLSNWIKKRIVSDEANNIIRNYYLIAGFSKGKAKREFFLQFKDVVDCVFAVKVIGEPNPEESEVIAQKAKEVNLKNIALENLEAALNLINRFSKTDHYLLVICGSLYLSRDIKNL